MRTAISPRLAMRTRVMACHIRLHRPTRLALFEERGHALAAFFGRADGGDQLGCVFIHRAFGAPALNTPGQRLDRRLRGRAAREQRLDGGGDGVVQLFVRDGAVDEADAGGEDCAEALAGQEQRQRAADADLLDDVRGDRRRREAEAHLREREHRRLRRDRDVGGGGQACAAAHRCALDARDDGLRALGDGAQHRGEALGVGAVVGLARRGHAAHPVQVSAGGERLALAGQHDDAHAAVRAELLEGGVQLGDQRLVEGVVHLRPRHRDGGDGAVAGDG